MSCIVLNFIRAKEYVCTMKCRFISLSTPTRVGPGLSRFVVWKIVPVMIFWSSMPCVFCLYTVLNVFSYYDLSVLSMSVMGFQKKVWMGWMGGVSSIHI